MQLSGNAEQFRHGISPNVSLLISE